MPDSTPTRRRRGELTAPGRAIARFNALKHGIHSARVIITDGPYPESEREFKHLSAQFHAEFAPFGIAEELLVERLLVLYWRLRRILVAETNLAAHRIQYTLRLEIQKAIVSASFDGNSPAEAAADPTLRAQVDRATIAAQLLHPDDIDRVTAHESTLEKAFFRTLRELHDLQRRRQRPAIPQSEAAPVHPTVAIRIDRLELHPQATPSSPTENPENEIPLPPTGNPIPTTNLSSHPSTPRPNRPASRSPNPVPEHRIPEPSRPLALIRVRRWRESKEMARGA